MKKIKKLIVILIILIIIITIVMIILLKNNKSKIANQEKNSLPTSEDVGEKYKTIMTRVNNYQTFFTIESYVKRLLIDIGAENSEAVNSLLSKQQTTITATNVKEALLLTNKKINYNVFNATEEYSTAGVAHIRYYVKGNVEDGTEIYAAITADNNNKTIDILPISKEEYSKKISQKELSDNIDYSIEKNNWNNAQAVTPKEEDMVNKYFNNYIKLADNNVNKAYDLLDSNYKEKKFGNIENYKKYLSDRSDLITLLDTSKRKKYTEFKTDEEYYMYYRQFANVGVAKYASLYHKDYKQYICYDQDGNIYIFNEKYPNEYNVILDEYTVDLEDTITKYNSASERDKVAMDVEKIRMAINDKDYKYIYSKLNDTFKNNNFATEDTLKTYLQKNLYDNNKFEAASLTEQNGVYVEKVKVTNNKNTSETKEITAVVKLKDNLEYEISFSI